MYFSNKAKKDGKQTGGLEDVYRHIELVSSLEEEFDESIVESFIRGRRGATGNDGRPYQILEGRG